MAIPFKIGFRKLNETRWIFEFIFCVAAYFVLLKVFASSTTPQMIDHIYTSIFLGLLIIAGAVNSWVIRKKFLRPNQFWVFLFLSLMNILFWALFHQILFDKLIDYILPGYYFISYYEYVDLVKFFFVYVALITLLDLSWEWFQLQETKHQLVLVEKERINAELKALTNQVNPHFLFNSLTVLYSLSLKNSSETSGAILKLSDILRYVIYESSNGEVPIRSEIELIRNYIDLQRYRINPKTRVEFSTEVKDENIPLNPMFLLPLVENSFKHGAKGSIDETYVYIDLRAKDDAIHFTIRNNKGKNADVEVPHGGIGLKNIEERLKLMYPGRHALNVQETDGEFFVSLVLKIA